MPRLSSLPICFIAFLMLLAATACSDPDKSGGNPGVTPPTVISVTPLDGAAGACPNTTVTATFSKAMNPATISATTFTLTGPAGAVTGVVTYDSSSDTAIFTPSSVLALTTTYTATITTGVRDVYGNMLATDFVWTFTTGIAPCIPPAPPVSVTPPDGSAGACPDSVVVATFPQAMDPTTINTNTFIVAPGITGTITHDVTNTIFTFTPSAPLGLSTTYTATITTGARDMFGVALVNDFVWTFTTSTTSCTAPPPPPTVISVTPPVGAAGLCPNSIVTATFSEAMNPATIDGTTFVLTGPGGTLVSGQVTYDTASDTAIFTPSNALALSSLYTATITTGAHDLLGTALTNNVVWSFTTGANPCQPPPPPHS